MNLKLSSRVDEDLIRCCFVFVVRINVSCVLMFVVSVNERSSGSDDALSFIMKRVRVCLKDV